MDRFKSILVVAGDDETTLRLLDRAEELARQNDASVSLLAVVENERRSSRSVRRPDGTRVELRQVLMDARLDELRHLTKEAGIPVSVGVAAGVDFVEVIRRVEAFEHDLVMAAPGPATNRLGPSVSSTTMHLLRKSPVPVWVDTERGGFRPDVAVAIAGGDDDHGELDPTLVQLGASLAARRGGTVHLVHAWRLPGESMLRRHRLGVSSDEIERMVVDELDGARDRLDLAEEGVRRVGAPVEVHLHKGDPADVIPAVLDDVEPGVLVMGTLARKGVRGVIIGNTAERVLGMVDSSILAVKPAGFRSPVLT